MDDKPTDTNPDNTPEAPEASEAPATQEPSIDTSASSVDSHETSNVSTSSETANTTQSSAPFELPIQSPERSKKPLIWSIVAGVVMLLLAGTALYFLVLNKPAEETPVANTSPSPTPAQELTAESLVKEVASQLKGTPAEIAERSATGGQLENGQLAYSAPAYQLTDKKFSVFPLKSYGAAATGTTDVADADYQKVTDFLAEQTFKQVEMQSDDPDNAGIYASDKIVCYVSNSEPLASSEHIVGIGCADVSSFEEAATAVEPFYNAYAASEDVKANPQLAEGVVLGEPKVKDGVEGHKHAELTLANAVGLFYQEPGKEWVFLMGLQQQPLCSQFDTDAIKKAFAGYACYDSMTQKESVVAV